MTGESETSVTMLSSDSHTMLSPDNTEHEATPNNVLLSSPSVLLPSDSSKVAVESVHDGDDQIDDNLRHYIEFIQGTCGCIKSGGKHCSSQFSAEYYLERHAQASLFTRSELDMVLLGSIMTTPYSRVTT